MKTVTREWVDKAEADYAAALLLRRSRKKHSRDIEVRYPGRTASSAEARTLLRATSGIRNLIRQSLGLR